MKKLFLLLAISCFSVAISQEFKANSVPADLVKNAYAVIRKDEKVVTIHALNKVVSMQDFVITVFDKSGDQYAEPYKFYDPSIKINNLEVSYFDKDGKLLKKFKEKDFSDQSYISGGQMYTESRVKYLSYTPTQYPYTVQFKSTVTNSNTRIDFWFPIFDYNLAIENSSYTLNNLMNLTLRSKELNLKEFGIESQNPSQSTIHYALKNLKALEKEELLPPKREIFPNVEFSANDFVIDGVKGSFTNWNEMGKWYNGLLNKSHDLTPTQKSFFQNLVKDAPNDKEKVKILYKFLQNKTRYIGVQLGIGGLKPFPASYVESKSYGDCKALSNYMQSILDAVGIKSYYTIVQAGERESFFTDFASIAQGNHVILYVPLADEDIWLETTSQQTAFNFLGRFTDDRNVLAIYPDGGKIIRTPKYPTEKNVDLKKGNWEILHDGKLKGSFVSTYSGIQYDYVYGIKFQGTQDQKRILKSLYDNIPHLEILKYTLDNNWDEAKFTTNLEVESPQFAKIFGNNISFNIVPAGVSSSNYKKSNQRKFPFQISYGFTDDYEFELKIPSNYRIDGEFETIKYESDFGRYELSLTKNDERTFLVKRKLIIKEGIYPKDKYNDYVEFRRKISSFDNSKLLLEKL